MLTISERNVAEVSAKAVEKEVYAESSSELALRIGRAANRAVRISGRSAADEQRVLSAMYDALAALNID